VLQVGSELRLVALDRPGRQPALDPLAHLGGAGAGEGDAQMLSGCARGSSRRSTRSASTRVLPVPALAATQTERRGSAARRWAGVGG
jgi:hypothetical protein